MVCWWVTRKEQEVYTLCLPKNSFLNYNFFFLFFFTAHHHPNWDFSVTVEYGTEATSVRQLLVEEKLFRSIPAIHRIRHSNPTSSTVSHTSECAVLSQGCVSTVAPSSGVGLSCFFFLFHRLVWDLTFIYSSLWGFIINSTGGRDMHLRK